MSQPAPAAAVAALNDAIWPQVTGAITREDQEHDKQDRIRERDGIDGDWIYTDDDSHLDFEDEDI